MSPLRASSRTRAFTVDHRDHIGHFGGVISAADVGTSGNQCLEVVRGFSLLLAVGSYGRGEWKVDQDRSIHLVGLGDLEVELFG